MSTSKTLHTEYDDATRNQFIGAMRWGGPEEENRTEGDGTGKCYRWLAKGDLMTKTGYGYAKCLTVAGTATPSRGI